PPGGPSGSFARPARWRASGLVRPRGGPSGSRLDSRGDDAGVQRDTPQAVRGRVGNAARSDDAGIGERELVTVGERISADDAHVRRVDARALRPGACRADL